MTRAAIYARFSTQMQSAASIEDQVRLCQDRAIREGWSIGPVHTDMALSGASMQRPGPQALLDGAEAGGFHVVIAEALDRLSRDQADMATLFKRLSFHGVRIVTLAEGDVNELHVGLKGTMNQLFLKDLADKTRRGLQGRVIVGKSGGGNAYGYRVLRSLGPDGLPITGERRIDPAEAAIIRRIFVDFADGHSRKAIARALNGEGIPGPRGMLWRDTAIRGHQSRGTGILNNELYVGRLVWNRQRYVKDPSTGKRVSRPNPPEAWITTEVPELRIIDDTLWDRVKARQGAIAESPRVLGIKASRFWEKKRRIHLLTGLVTCGRCGGAMGNVGRDYLACTNARRLGTCTERQSIRRAVLEEAVLDLLRDRLMRPDAVASFIASLTREMNARRGTETARRQRLEAERGALCRKLDGLYDAIAEGLRTPGLREKLEALEARKAELEALIAAPAPSPVRLHPNLAELYRRNVIELSQTLQDPALRVPALERIRGLITGVRVRHEADFVLLELDGALSAMVGLAQGGTAKSPLGSGLDASSVQVVAGARIANCFAMSNAIIAPCPVTQRP